MYYCSTLSAEFLRVSLHEGREGASLESITRANAGLSINGQELRVRLKLTLTLIYISICILHFLGSFKPEAKGWPFKVEVKIMALC